MDSIKAEFICRNFGFSFPNIANFTKSQWGCPQYLFVIYRVCLAIFQTGFWLLVMIGNALHTSFVFDAINIPQLTAFGYTILTLFAISAATLAVVELIYPTSDLPLAGIEFKKPIAEENNEENVEKTQPYPENKLTYRYKFVWIVFVLAAPSAFLITIGFFVFLFPNRKTNFNFLRDIIVHGTNSLIILVEISINAIPVRILHGIYPVIFGAFYILFTLFYWWANEKRNIVYEDILNWNHPVKPIVISVLGICVAVPLAHLFVFACYKLRIYVCRKLTTRCKNREEYIRLASGENPQ